MDFFDYDVIYGFENLYQAHRMAKRGKRYTDEVMRFEFSLSQELADIQYELKYGRYRIRPVQAIYGVRSERKSDICSGVS